jgi:uncharacterized protein YbaP (TraB family)
MEMKRLLIFALLFSCAPCALAKPPVPFLWQASDGDNNVYLLGSFHLLKASDYPLAASVGKAFDAAEVVYFEISPDEMDNPDLARKMMQLGMFPGGKTLQQSLKVETWSRLEKYCAARKIPIAHFQKFEPWLLALMLSIAEMQKAGLQPEFGLDKHFAKLAKAAGKKTGALETLEEQFALLDGMNAEEQEQSLSQSLEESDKTQQDVNELHRLWRNGDAERLLKLSVQEMTQKTPRLYQRIFVARNNAWLPRIAAFLEDNTQDDALVVVGSMHLLGDDGLVELLKKRGYRVDRLR